MVAVMGLFAFAACGGDDDEEKTPAATTAGATATAAGGGEVEALAAIFYPESGRVALREAIEQNLIDNFLFVDGTKSQSMFDEIGVEAFEGMYGTQAGTANKEFATVFTAAGGNPDAPYVREGYDTAYLIALAAVSANSTKGTDIRDNLRFVANPPGEKIGFGADEFTRAVSLLAAGTDIDYVGASGPVDLDANGDLASGLVEIWQIVKGKITSQEARTADLAKDTGTDVPAGSQKRAATAPTSPLKIGVIMSTTGDLSTFGPPINDSIVMAIGEINKAGGVFGQDVTLATADDATNPDQGQAAARQLVDVQGVHAIIGALASGVSLPIAENVTSPAGVLQISPASTAPTLTTARDDDLLFRTPISDVAQAQVLAAFADELGLKTVCTLYVNSDYGQGLSEGFVKNFEALGGSVPAQVPIEQQQTTYISEIRRCVGK
ncbi:MAG: ABC transporter substrate-binding protein [Dehalococcoidia bacterium]|nr:ABC transporter substrate-binding protein [Dehalococcoidia bacterium]